MSDRRYTDSSSGTPTHHQRPSAKNSRSNGKEDVSASKSHHPPVISESIIVECKAAFISAVKGASISKPLTSKSELLLALQNTGRNPTQRSLSKHWTSTTEEINFDEFCKICQKEPVTTVDDLMKAFKKIDINGDGYLSHSELKKVMTTKGEKMSDEEVTKLIDDVDENKDGKLDYNEFCNLVLNTSKQCKQKAIQRFEKKTPVDGDNGAEKKTSINGTLEIENKHRDDESGKHKRSSAAKGSSSEADSLSRDRGSRHDRENKYSHRERRDSTGSTKERKPSAVDGTESKKGVPMSPRMSPRVSPRIPKGAKNREEPQKDKYGSQASLRSHDSKVNAKTHRPLQSSTLHQSSKSTIIDTDDDDDVVISLPPKHIVPTATGTLGGTPMPRPRVASIEKKGNGYAISTDGSPKPAPRQVNRQEMSKPAVSSLNLRLQMPKRLSEWREVKRRGMLYVEENGEVMSTQYSLVLGKTSSVWISISPSPAQSTARVDVPLDMTVFVIRSKADKHGHSMVTFTERRDISGNYGVRCDLEAGKYYLLVATSGCSLPISKPSKEEQKKLVKKKASADGDHYVLSKEFKYVLTDIFNMVDTDMNGRLSREEFNQYSMRTGEDEIGDDEWDIVKDNAELNKGELTCKGFMKLIELEADDAKGDTDDLWIALEALGYDTSLTQNQAYPFTLEVYVEMGEAPALNPLSGLLSSKSKSLQAALKEAYTNKGELLPSEWRCHSAKTSGNERDVRVYMFETDTLMVIAIDNKLPTRATVKLDCSSSKNVKSNTKSLCEVFAVAATTFMVAFYLVPADESKEWLVSCVEKDLLTTS